jgi:hypothetical protein
MAGITISPSPELDKPEISCAEKFDTLRIKGLRKSQTKPPPFFTP